MVCCRHFPIDMHILFHEVFSICAQVTYFMTCTSTVDCKIGRNYPNDPKKAKQINTNEYKC